MGTAFVLFAVGAHCVGDPGTSDVLGGVLHGLGGLSSAFGVVALGFAAHESSIRARFTHGQVSGQHPSWSSKRRRMPVTAPPALSGPGLAGEIGVVPIVGIILVLLGFFLMRRFSQKARSYEMSNRISIVIEKPGLPACRDMVYT